MKKVVFFSDIHGNITGLHAVLREIEKLEEVEHIVCLGDYFGYSAGHNEIMDLFLEKNVVMLRGNHEDMMQEIDQARENTDFFPSIYFTHDWLRQHLKGDYYDHLLSLPMTFSLRLNDQYSLICFHAAAHDTKSRTCGPDVPPEVLGETYGALAENIVVYGHYHDPHVMPFQNKLLVNCASVGMRKTDSLSNYTIIEYDDQKIAILQRQVPYDKDEEEKLVAERGMMCAW